ncbi:MAG: aminodeoxychorismate/anthranilate synthase component II [Cellvibrionales bacterium TMED148]|nr:anthranilate/aminodeoxychorismate synthase component II [Porticoccaceae bacterium]RPG88353.1 MAG: aminodeoxychorismate/anthranilate synthase component II [Cellvibrionales bacterium TMED148]
MIDNYDSFTFNVVQYIRELGGIVSVYRNDEISVEDVGNLSPERIVISPGPCTPSEAGISMGLIKEFSGHIPIFGICLGHQSIGQAMGGRVVRAGSIMHGKTSLIHHTGRGIFSGLKNPFVATRYHSLVLDPEHLPDSLSVTAWSLTPEGDFDSIMGVQHKSHSVHGVQFHPESIMTEHGHALLKNFLECV